MTVLLKPPDRRWPRVSQVDKSPPSDTISDLHEWPAA